MALWARRERLDRLLYLIIKANSGVLKNGPMLGAESQSQRLEIVLPVLSLNFPGSAIPSRHDYNCHA